MKRLLVGVVLAIALASCGDSRPDPPPGGKEICEAFGGDKLVYDENISSWTCVDISSGRTDYVF